MKDRPFFSVVMPTRNRSTLLPLAVESVLAQSFTDFELIISDNFSNDQTPEVIDSFRDDRIRAFRTESSLSIGDSYSFAQSQARGEFVVLASDDDALTPVLLEKCKEAIDKFGAEVVAFRFALFYHDDTTNLNRSIAAKTLAVQPFSDDVACFTADEAKHQLLALYGLSDVKRDDRFIVTFINNAAIHRSVYKRIKQVRPALFDLTPADMYLAAAMFFVADRYYCLDLPLYVWSSWEGNATATAVRKGNALRDHFEKLLDGKRLERTPLKFALPENCTINAILEAFNDFGSTIPINWVRYYEYIYDNLMILKNKQIDVSQELSEFDAVLSSEPPEVQKEVRSRISSLRFRSKQMIRRWPAGVRSVKKMIGDRSDDRILIDGDSSGFSDALGAARSLTNLVGNGRS